MLDVRQRDSAYFKTDPTLDKAQGIVRGTGDFVWTYFCQKSADARQTGANNEDAIAWQMDDSAQIMAFALCDGVSGSYLGYVAANFLADKLVRLMMQLASDPAMAETIDSLALQQHLDAWIADGQQQVEQQQISTVNNSFLAEVIRVRQREGSHAVFFSGYIDLRPAHASLFAWLGNVSGQVYDKEQHELLDLSLMQDDRNRWTTTYGCLGSPCVFRVVDAAIGSVLLYSDGLAKLSGELVSSLNTDREGLLRKLAESEFQDDASLLSITLSTNNRSDDGALEAQLSTDETVAAGQPVDSPGQPEAMQAQAAQLETPVPNNSLAGAARVENLPVWRSRRSNRQLVIGAILLVLLILVIVAVLLLSSLLE